MTSWSPVDLSLADECTLLGHDNQIFAVLAEHGPSTWVNGTHGPRDEGTLGDPDTAQLERQMSHF